MNLKEKRLSSHRYKKAKYIVIVISLKLRIHNLSHSKIIPSYMYYYLNLKKNLLNFTMSIYILFLV